MVDRPVMGFFGAYRFLSNFWPSEVEYEGERFATVEHAYQAAKTLDPTERMLIRIAASPGQAKRLGKQVRRWADFEGHKREIMADLVWQKFSKHPELRRKLLETGDRLLVEDNVWGDTYWGVCKGTGWNHLGLILMEVRERCKVL